MRERIPDVANPFRLTYSLFMASAEYYKIRRNKHRAMAILHLGGACSRCGSKSNLEFDHKVAQINGGTKARNVSEMLHYRWETILKELELCQLLCQACHYSKTLEDLPDGHSGKGRKHRIKSYNSGCRCKKCIIVGRAHNKARRDARARETGKSPSSLPRGVWLLPNGKYRAVTTVSRKAKSLGTFATPEEAHAAYVAFNNEIRPGHEVELRYNID